MAFLSKLGNMLKLTSSRQIGSGVSSPFKLSNLQAIRCMSTGESAKIFIGGVSFQSDEQSLREEFAKYGEVVDVRIITDRETGRSRGFGFVTYTSSEEASSAIQALDGKELHGRTVRVNYATDRPRTNFGGGGYGGGGYGSGGYGGGGGGYGGGGGGYSGSGGGYGGGGDSYGSGNTGGGYGGSGGGYNASSGDSFGSPAGGASGDQFGDDAPADFEKRA